MNLCAFCWHDAALRAEADTSKSQTEHYMEILAESEDGSCRSTFGRRDPDAVLGSEAAMADWVAFLCGERPINGFWFGDRPPPPLKPYWWRSKLRAAYERESQPAEAAAWFDAPRRRRAAAKPAAPQEPAAPPAQSTEPEEHLCAVCREIWRDPDEPIRISERWLEWEAINKQVCAERDAALAELATLRAAAPSQSTEPVIVYADRYVGKWSDQPESYWLQRLMQEVGELASVLAGDHPDTVEHELTQIGSIAVNWLRLRAAAPSQSQPAACSFCGRERELRFGACFECVTRAVQPAAPQPERVGISNPYKDYLITRAAPSQSQPARDFGALFDAKANAHLLLADQPAAPQPETREPFCGGRFGECNLSECQKWGRCRASAPEGDRAAEGRVKEDSIEPSPFLALSDKTTERFPCGCLRVTTLTPCTEHDAEARRQMEQEE